MDALWTLDGDETSWAAWAEDMAQAPASLLVTEWVAAFRIDRPGWALDVGCGTGRAFRPLAEAGYRVVGLDPVGRGLRLARDRALTDGLAAWSIQGTAARLPFRTASVALVLGMSVLFHLSPGELEESLREISRVLLPDGKALLHFLDVGDWRRNLARQISPGQAPVPGYRAVVTCFCPAEILRDWVEAAGLRVESLELKTSRSESGEQRNWFLQCSRSEK
ncbi:MAG TPA: class I SAM-dependent methyltransferase [Anaerolineales bacterium]|nr:class I SAM-dependent methyltransferase [Anaerolineales bacterium]